MTESRLVTQPEERYFLGPLGLIRRTRDDLRPLPRWAADTWQNARGW